MRAAFTDLTSAVGKLRSIDNDLQASLPLALGNPQLLERHQIIRHALVVTLCGYFESFLKRLAERYIGAVCAKALKFEDLPLEIQRYHYEHGGTILQQIARSTFGKKPHQWIIATPADIAMRLASPQLPPPYSILWEGFADTKANPGVETINSFLARCSIGEPKKSLEAKVRKRGRTFQTELDSFLSVRHECAHSGVSAVQVTSSELQGYGDLIEAVAESMVELMEDRLAQPPF
jgi:hypothetical protein